MPAQILITHEQLTVLAETGHPVVVLETNGGGDALDNTLEGWVIDGRPDGGHRSIVVDKHGEIIGDMDGEADD